MFDRIIRLRGAVNFEPARRVSHGYELDPSFNRGYTLVVRDYIVAEDYSLAEFEALVKTEAAKKAETESFRQAFANLIPPNND